MANPILSTVQLVMSTALVADNLKFLKKKDKGVEGFAGQAIKNIIGADLISSTADFI